MSYLCYLCLFSIVVSNTSCVVLLFCFSSSVASISRLSFFIAPSVFSNVNLVYFTFVMRHNIVHRRVLRVMIYFLQEICHHCNQRYYVIPHRMDQMGIIIICECYFCSLNTEDVNIVDFTLL